MTRCVRLVVFTAAVVAAGAPTVEGACSVQAASNASFGGGATSFVVRDVSLQTSTPASGLTCSGAILSVLQSGDHVRATITSANGGLTGPTGDLVTYTIYGDSTTTYPIATNVPYDYASGQLINLLGLFGGPATSVPLFFRTTTGANVAAGTYTDTLTINWSWNYCSGIGIGGICLGRDIGSGLAVLEVSLTVTNACAITATPDVLFGQAPVPSAFAPVFQSLAVVCTKDLASYSVGIDAGQHVAGSVRRMAGAGAYLEYGIYKGSSEDEWGASGAARAASPGPADGAIPHQFPYTVRILLPQDVAPAGTYTDVIVVDVVF